MSTLKPLFTWRSAVCDSGLSPSTRHIALALSLYMSERGDSAFPGADRLAHDTGLHVSTVRERLAELVAEQWLDLVEKGGTKGEKRHANVYRATVPPTPLALGDPSPETTRRPGRADPSPEPRQPLASGDPISSLTHQELRANASQEEPWRPSVDELQAGRDRADDALKVARSKLGLTTDDAA